MLVEQRNKISDEVIDSHTHYTEVTLEDIAKDLYPEHDADTKLPVTITVNGDIIIQRRWPKYRPHRDSTVILYHEPKGPLLPIIVTAAVSYAVSYAVNYLTKPKLDNYNPTAEGKSIHQAAGRANTPRLGSPPAEIFGRHKYWPDLISAPWRAYENNVQYLYLLLSTGVGEYDYEEINIGNTPIDRLTGFDVSIFAPDTDVTSHPAHQHIYTSDEVGNTTSSAGLEIEGGGYASANNAMPDGLYYDFDDNTIMAFSSPDAGQTLIPYDWPYAVNDYISVNSQFNSGTYRVSAIVGNTLTLTDDEGDAVILTGTESQNATIDQVNPTTEGDWLGPYLATPSGTTSDTLIFDLLYQGGIGKENDEGNIEARTIDLEIAYKPVDADDDAWQVQSVSKTDATRDDVGDTITINTGTAAAYECRIRRTSASSDSTAVRDTVLWQALKCSLPTNSQYADISVMALRIPGNVTIAANAQNQVNTVQTRKLPVFDSDDQETLVATSRIADAFAYLVRGLYPESVLRIEELQQLSAQWEAAEQAFNGVFDTGTTFKEAADRILNVGFASHYPAKGQIHIVHDRPREAFGQFFSMDNCTAMKESGQGRGHDDYDGVQIEYTDSETWLPAFVECVLPENSGDNLQAIRLYGCTDRDLAYRYGMRKASEMHYLFKKWSITTEQEGLNARLGEKCSLPSRATQDGFCTGYHNRVMTLSHELDIDADTDYMIAIRQRDGTQLQYGCTKVTNNSVRLDDDLGFVPMFNDASDPPLFKLGTHHDFVIPAIVQEIKPKAKGKVDVNLIMYDDRIFNYDNASAPEDS